MEEDRWSVRLLYNVLQPVTGSSYRGRYLAIYNIYLGTFESAPSIPDLSPSGSTNTVDSTLVQSLITNFSHL